MFENVPAFTTKEQKMRRLLLPLIIVFTAFGSQAKATGYLLNDYFGVNLTVNSDGQFNMPWNPARGFMTHENWGTDGDEFAPDPGPRYYLSEAFDLEAMYIDYDWANNQVVYSIVTSMPNTGFNQVPWYPGYVFKAGDIRFQLGSNTYVVGTHDGFLGNLYYNPTMTYTDSYRGFAERGNPMLANSNLGMELTTSDNFEFSYSEYLDQNGQSLIENGYATYVMEGKISFDDLGGVPSNGITMTLGMSCNNDIASVTAVPEPSTLALFGIGIAGLAAGRRRLKK